MKRLRFALKYPEGQGREFIQRAGTPRGKNAGEDADGVDRR